MFGASESYSIWLGYEQGVAGQHGSRETHVIRATMAIENDADRAFAPSDLPEERRGIAKELPQAAGDFAHCKGFEGFEFGCSEVIVGEMVEVVADRLEAPFTLFAVRCFA